MFAIGSFTHKDMRWLKIEIVETLVLRITVELKQDLLEYQHVLVVHEVVNSFDIALF